jgi:hypothetical protein
MSMISNGYGQMNYKSDLIFHSNIIIGFLGGRLPSINGITPYNYINILLLIYGYISINELVMKKIKNFNISYLIVLSSSFFILIRPTFTTISAYIAIAGLLNLDHARTTKNTRYVVSGLILILIATLIRDEMVIFILLFTSIITYRIIVNTRKKYLKYLIAFLVVFLSLQIINRIPYGNENLKNLRTFAKSQVQITDYNADNFLMNHERILKNNDYTINDIKLIRNWFFTDLHLIDSNRLQRLLKDSKWNGSYNNLDLGQSINSSISLISSYPINIVLLATLLIFGFSKKNRDLYILWMLFALSIVFGALIGRSLLYVYYPLLVFLFIYNCLNVIYAKNTYRFVVLFLSFSILIVNIVSNINNRRDMEIAKSEYNDIQLDNLWVIGGGISLPHIFPLMESDLKYKDLKLIATDWSIYSPNSNFLKFNANNEFISQLQSSNGVNVSINNYLLPLIQIYCKEKFGTDIIESKLIDKNFIRVSNIKCPSNQINITSPTMEFSYGNRGFIWLTSDMTSFTITNYSNNSYFDDFDLVFENNPCKFDITFTIKSEYFKQTLSSEQGNTKLRLKLAPYETLTVYAELPFKQELCKANNEDKRRFIAKLINEY